MDNPETRLSLYEYSKVAQHNLVLNIKQIGEWAWIFIPPNISRYCDLFQVTEMLPNNVEVNYLKKIHRDCRKPWLRANWSILNKGIGYHLYQFSFVDPKNADVYNMYIAYTIQDDNPEKPYIYNRSKEDTE